MGKLYKKISIFLTFLLICGNVLAANPKAKRVRIIDSGTYYTGTEVESALQEIGAGTTLDSRYINSAGDSGYSGAHNAGAASFEIPNSTSLPGTCVVGQLYMDTNATSGQRFYLCESADTWALQGDGAGGGSGSVTTIKEATVQVGDADIVTLDFGAGFDLTETPDTEINIVLDFTEVSGHDDFTDFVANEHIDWTGVDFWTASAQANLTSEVVVNNEATLETALGGIDVIVSTEIDSFSELDTIVTDKALVNKADGAVWLGVHDFGGATSLEGVNNATPTTDATGEFALDTTITDHQPLWQYYDGGENMSIIAIDTAELPALDNEIVKYDAATDKFVLEADADSGGAPEGTAVLSTGEGGGTKFLREDGDGTSSWQTPSGGSGAYSDAADPVVLNTTTKDSILAGASQINSAKTSVDGDADQVQFALQSHSTQTSNVVEQEQSDGTIVYTRADNGDTTIGSGASGSVDFGTNTIDDTLAGNIQKGYVTLPIQSGKLTGTFITAGAAIDAGEGVFRGLFDASTTEEMVWSFRLPYDYNNSPVIKIQYTMDTATSGKVDPEVKVMAVSDGDSADINTASFDTLNEITGGTTVPGTAGYLDEISLSLANFDSAAAGDHLVIHIQRDHDDGDDTAAGDMEIINIQLEYNRK